MSEKKDFLNQLASDIKKPDSFQEEQFEKVEKPKININPKWIAAGVAALIIILLAVWFFFFRAKITMPNFVGQTTSDLSAWVRQEGIEAQGIVIKEEYNFDYDSGVIMEQSVAEGKKVKEDVKITFVASLGADPSEHVDFIDNVLAQTQSDIQEWIDSNKLMKVKFSQVYSDEVEKGYVISFNLNGIETTDFTRSTNVTFNISRGPQPAGTITVEDFKGKLEEYVTDWAKTKKVELKVINSYSDTVAAGSVIDQNIASGKTMKEGETLTITVSKGKAIKLPDFTKMSSEDYTAWLSNADNKSVNIVEKKQYSETGGYILNQSIAAGKYVGVDETLTLTISLGFPRLSMYDQGPNIVGTNYQDFVDWLNQQRQYGADMYAGSWSSGDSYSYEHSKGKILSVICSDYSSGQVVACDGNLPLDARFDVARSLGKMYDVKSDEITGKNLATLVDYLSGKELTFIIGKRPDNTDISSTDTVKLLDKNGNLVGTGQLYQGDVYKIEYVSTQP